MFTDRSLINIDCYEAVMSMAMAREREREREKGLKERKIVR